MVHCLEEILHHRASPEDAKIPEILVQTIAMPQAIPAMSCSSHAWARAVQNVQCDRLPDAIFPEGIIEDVVR